MKRPALILTGVLAAQLGLALLLTFRGSDNAAFEAKEPLLAFDTAKIDQIAIDENAANSVILDKLDGKWVIPSFAGFPADQAKVEGMLSQLAGLKKGWPVAETAGAAERFKLTENSHDRRIALKSGGKTAGDIFIGTSPSFRQVHARVGGSDKIYAVEISAYDAGARAEEWINRDFLGIPQDKIASISLGDIKLEGKDGKFTLAGLVEGEKPLEGKIQALVRAVSHPVFDAVQGKGKEALAQLEDPTFEIALTRTDGTSLTYKYKKEAAGGAYIFASSAHAYVFRAAENSISAIAGAKREALLQQSAPKPVPETKAAPKPEPPPAAVHEPSSGEKTGAKAEPAADNGADAKPDAVPAASGVVHSEVPPGGGGEANASSAAAKDTALKPEPAPEAAAEDKPTPAIASDQKPAAEAAPAMTGEPAPEAKPVPPSGNSQPDSAQVPQSEASPAGGG
jgi:hypothetical protein